MRNDSEDRASAARSYATQPLAERSPPGGPTPFPTHDLQAREHFLSRVGDVLSSSLDYRETIQSVARLCTAFLADYCIVHVEDGEEIRALGIAHTDASREPGLREILRLLPIGPTSRNPVVEVLRTGTPRLMSEVGDDELARLTGASPHGERLRELGLRSVLVVPLNARGRTLGAISLARSGDAVPYSKADIATVEELARRAALPVDNARLYREARRESLARERTLGVVSHDLRNALNAATMYAELIADMNPERLATGQGHKQVRGLKRALGHMQRLVQDLLDVENIESGRLSLRLDLLDLDALAGEIEEMFAPRAADREISFVVDLPEPARRVRADHVRIVQVLSNLISNALEFTPSGGRITVSGHVERDLLHVCVKDTGAGIDEEDLSRVFDRHWRGVTTARSSSGSGLGLTIVRGIVHAHGGEAWVSSVRGEGSAFYFTLPLEVSCEGKAAD